MKDSNYYSTFMAVAEDSKATEAKLPKPRGSKKTAAQIQFEMMHQHPNRFTQEDVLFAIWRNKQDDEPSEEELEIQRFQFFKKPQPCLRTSALAKIHGWGILFDNDGKTSLFAVESDEYRRHAGNKDLQQLKAMRTKRAR